MQSRIYLGGFMQNQLPVIICELHTIVRTWNGGQASYIKRLQVPDAYVAQALDTKVGAIPANFFFSL
jgi:hypothetical protein